MRGNTMSICHIIGAGEIGTKDIEQLKIIAPGDMIIAADGGLVPLIANAIIPNTVIGDFDSFSGDLSSLPQSIEVIKLQPEKDYTDMHTCVNYGLEKGFNTFFLYGATGGRIDHTIANIQLMHMLAEQDCQVIMFGADNTFQVISNGSIEFQADKTGIISVFSLSERSFGVTISGLKYETWDATLNNTFALGVSNEFTGLPASIAVRRGSLLIISSR